jgi:hypothetical protein
MGNEFSISVSTAGTEKLILKARSNRNANVTDSLAFFNPPTPCLAKSGISIYSYWVLLVLIVAVILAERMFGGHPLARRLEA